MTRRAGAALAGAALFVLSMMWGAAPAGAHALLLASTPADGSSVERSPIQAILTFTEVPDRVLSVVHVLDASGRQVETGRPEPVVGQPTQLSVPLGTLPQGPYTVTWRTTSAVDGHTTAGSVAFGVGVAVTAVGGVGGPSAVESPSPTAAGVAGRWLFYAGVVLLLGAAVVGAVVVSDPNAISRVALGAAWVAAAGGLLLIAADQRATARTGLANLLSSSTGHKLATEAVAVGLAGLAVVCACLRRRRWSLAMVGVGASAVMMARSLAGHADASSARWFTVGVQWAHLVSVGAWVGGLVWLLWAIRRGDQGQGRGLARRFSTVAGVTLAVVTVSGTVRAFNEVGAWTRLVHTDFGVALLVKLSLFAVLVTLGALGRFRHVPSAAAKGFGALRRVVRWEVVVGAGALGATAVLAGLAPSVLVAAASKPTAPPNVTVSGNDYATSVRVRLVVSPGLAGPNQFDATVADYDSGQPVAAQTVSLRFQIDDHPEIAPATLDLTRAADAHWRGFGRPLSIDGRWTVTATVQTPGDAVEVPMSLVPRRPAIRSTPVPGAGPTGPCGEGKPNPAYVMTVDSDPDPPRLEGATLHLTVRRDGKAVTGAKLCVGARMPDMVHPGVSTVAKEVSDGRYDAQFTFGMGGYWAGSVTIAEPGKPAVSVPLSLQVG